jgi:hypothetical protein
VQQNKVGEPKYSKLFGHFSLALLIGTSSVLSAESFADFKRTQVESFKQYKDERDEAFNKFLKAQWKEYNAFKGTPLYEKPKPKNIPSAKAIPIKSVGPKVTIKIEKVKFVEPKPVQEVVIVKKPEVIQKPVVVEKPVAVEKPKVTQKPVVVEKPIIVKKQEPIAKPEVKLAVSKDINFDFFGTPLGFDIPSKIKTATFYPQNQKGISGFFDSAASSDYDYLVGEIQRVSKEMNLNGWGIYLLVTTISDHTYTDSDKSKLLSWFLFNKLGYAVKIGVANSHVVLMHYSKKTIYSTPNYTIDKKKYYVVANYAKGNVGSLYSYAQNYPGADKPLDMSLNTLPKFSSDMKSKTLSYKKFGNKIEVPFRYNKNLIDFMATYPQADYETFFNAPMDERTYSDVAKGLKKYVDGKKASDAMNFVLNFVQNAFAYERDDQQFGREKVMFASETLYYDKSDCEDRATLFSYLVKELFGIGVVGVKYKDHMSTALYVPMEGDSIMAGARKFVLADPTYINASIGQEMPKYKSQKPDSFVVIKAQ